VFESGRAHHFDVEPIASGLNRPTFVGAAPGDTDALWVLEQPGRVLRVDHTTTTVVLDLSDRVKTGAEQGLLGMAFHPDFAMDPRLYVHWTDRAGDTRVGEFEVRPDGIVSPQPRRELLHLDQPEDNHNGGQLAFGPDGRLYLGLGDGGGAFDPRHAAQSLRTLLGKIVSVDVEAAKPRWRIDLYGLRNPWRFSFDLALGEVWVADVGQDETEEVNRVHLDPEQPPKNLGWSVFEGVHRIQRRRLHPRGELIWPVASYTHTDGCSITGGHIYHGTELPELAGRYLYGDLCTGTLWSLEPAPHRRAADVRREHAKVPQLTHIGEDPEGELVFASAAGTLYRAVPPG
jgi:glucose/arabinose dehydrogenase